MNMKSFPMIVNVFILLLLWSDLSRAEYVLVGELPQAQAPVEVQTQADLPEVPFVTSAETVALSANIVNATVGINYYGSYLVNSGPSPNINPAVYSCVEACATIYGGSSSDFHCSTSYSSLTYTAYYAGYNVGNCVTKPEDYVLGTTFNCGTTGCAYSAYINYYCTASNYCWVSSPSTPPTPQPTTARPTSMPTSGRSYYVSSGPLWTGNPPVYSCVQACAMVYGGSASNYHCSTISSSINYSGYYAGYGLGGCAAESETYSVGTNFNCGYTGCAYSAYVDYNCNYPNYCWGAQSPTVSPTSRVTTPTQLPTAVSVRSYLVNNGPVWTSNPPVYSCIQACALIYGGLANDYHCSTSSSSMTYTGNYAEYGISGCVTMAETASVGSNFYCGSTSCAYSAYVQYNCYNPNYCWKTTTASVTPTAQPSTAKPTTMPTNSARSYSVSSGPNSSTNPPVYSCVQACAIVYGGSASNYHCSTSLTSLTYTGFYAEYGLSGCVTMSETSSLGTNYNCGYTGCAYSAYVSDGCFNTNYCWISTSTPAPSPQPSTFKPTSMPTNSIQSYYVSSGPLYTTNPPVYSCVQACAQVYGGSASNYHCSNSQLSITYTGYYSEYGFPGCVSESETYSVGTNYNCGSTGCAYSAYVQDNCYNPNYCWVSQNPTVSPTFHVVTPTPTSRPTTAPSPQPSIVKPTSMPTNSVRSYYVSSGPLWSTNPPNYSCVQACALVFGGSASSYHCSISSSTITYTGYYSEYGFSGCVTASEIYSVGTNYNCGYTGCAYSAYVQDNCYNPNYCWISQSPTASPTLHVVTPTPTSKPTVNTHNYYVSNGPLWTSNPPVYSCVQACAIVFGGSASNYHCSTSSSTITYSGYYAEYGSGGCTLASETYLVGTNFNCGYQGCAYSAYVEYNCYSQNYCFAQVSPSSNDDDSSNNPSKLTKVTVLIIVLTILGAMAFGAAMAALVYWFCFKVEVNSDLTASLATPVPEENNNTTREEDIPTKC